jgi:uncharacterized protein (DUF427 family)
LIAQSDRAIDMHEASYPPTLYVPLEDVDQRLLRRSEERTWCRYKGEASYYDIVDGDSVHLSAAAWYYDHPFPAVAAIESHVPSTPTGSPSLRSQADLP